jgi:cell wall-associated NlpC family hydrolase
MALATAVLATAAGGAAEAKSNIEPPLPKTQVATLSDQAVAVLPDPGAKLTTARVFAIPASARRKLVALESDGNMPSANADEQMWGAVSSKPSNQIDRFARGILNRTSSIAMSLTRSAMRFIGTPYVFGGTSPSGFDCSGYVQHVFAMLGISLPRTADAQYYAGKPIVGGLHMGDLVFFQTYLPGPSHVGIYLHDGKFIASSGHGVMVSSLSDSYWAARYIGAKRVLKLR